MTLSAKQIADSVNAGKSSREEHFEESIRSVKQNQGFGAWQWLYDNLDLSESRRPRIADSDYSSLNGVPLGFKDIFNSIDGTTEMGSDLWKDHKAGNDARIISISNEAGCSVLGKTKTAEFAVHALPEVYNPWDIKRTTGTSSSGSAVAVLTGDTPIAFGTQTAGSISRPASFCGVIGFKPTFGIFPRTGVLKTCDPFDTVGYFCSHYEDVEHVFDSIRLKGSNYPFIERGLDDASKLMESKESITIGRVITDSRDFEDEDITVAVNNYCSDLPKKFKIEPLDLRDTLSEARILQEMIYHKSLSYYFSEERKAGVKYSDIMKKIFFEGDKVTGEEFISYIRQLEQLRIDAQRKLSGFDLLISPTTSTVAPLRDDSETIDSSLFWTMLHLPLVSLPLFESVSIGMPFGLQLIGAQKYFEPFIFNFIRELGLTNSSIKEPTN